MILIMMITAFLCVLSTINANSGGAPPVACQNRMPQHGADVKAQSSVAPYSISVEPMHYSSGTTVTVTLMGLSTTKFKGYLLTMRRVEDNTTIVAGFSVPNGGQLLACDGQNNADVTHTENSDKTSVSFTWTAPAQSEGSLQVFATVVQDKETFWTMLKSDPITPSQTTTTAGGQGTTTTAGGQETTTSNNSAAFTVSSFLGILGAVVITVLML